MINILWNQNKKISKKIDRDRKDKKYREIREIRKIKEIKVVQRKKIRFIVKIVIFLVNLIMKKIYNL